MRYLLSLLLFLSVAFSQNVNDKNFKEKINGGVVVAIFTAEWQEQDLDKKILKGVEGYQDAEILWVKSEQAKKVVKKLRFRNFPSIASLLGTFSYTLNSFKNLTSSWRAAATAAGSSLAPVISS